MTHGTVRQSIIDITIASDKLAHKINNWHINLEVCPTSDHNAIEYQLSFNRKQLTKTMTQTTYKYNYKRDQIDWDNFRDTMKNNTEHIKDKNIEAMNTDELEEYIETITKAIQKTCDKTLPRKGKTRSHNPWWNAELDSIKKNLIRLHHRIHHLKIRNKPLDNILAEREALKTEYTAALSKASTDSFREFCSKQGKEDVWSLTNRLLKNGPPARPPATLRLENDQETADSRDTAEALLQRFYPDDTPDANTKQESIRHTSNLTPDTPDEPQFSEAEVIDCLRSMNPNKAPGPDHLTSDICLEFANLHPKLLTRIMNKCLADSYFPKCWKAAFVKALPKPGKEDYSSITTYRPIGLLNIFGKLLEKLIIKRLNYHMRSTGNHNPLQFGFKEQTSTIDALNTAITTIRKAKDNKQQVIAVSLDIKAAFDNAWWPALLTRLQNIKCPRNIYRIIQSYLNERTVTLNYADATTTKIMTRGCVQGSVCGPTFWNIILDELLTLQFPNGCHIQAFADDVLLIVKAKTTTDLQHIANNALQQIHSWGESVKLKFGPSKTQLIAFSPKASKSNIFINNLPLKPVNSIKLLGVIIDNKLKFIKHTQHAIAKAHKIHKKLCIYVRPTWGIQSENISIIYRHVIEPIITYAAGIWGDAIRHKTVRDSLQTLQRGFAIKAIKGFRTISATAAIALAGYTPLHLKIKERSIVEKTRIGQETQYLPGDVTLEKPSKPESLLHPSLRIPHTFELATEQTQIDQICTINTVKIYTDGSKTDEGEVGAAFVAYLPNGTKIIKKYKLHNSCSVFQAELLALSKSCDWIAASQYQDITICTDSRSSLQEISNQNSTNPFVTNIHQTLHKYIGRIKLVWVKAHIGIEGNEEADSAAKAAATSHKAPDYTSYPISFIKHKIKQENRALSNETYQTSQTGVHTREWCPDLTSISELNVAIKPSFALTQVLTGHGYHLAYLHRFKITNTDQCPCDLSTTQTINHLLKECPQYSKIRFEHEQTCNYLQIDPYDLKELLTKDNAIKSFINYIEKLINNLKRFNGT